ncbi:alpha-1,2-mannosidase, putative [Arenibacter nanhaiticus]|uniref:Alpha-1,2-mannosidase, putative n=1 Tax=Arenibacter nanhaiticus TaxID=558155 RepID=A0A1M6M196_9FLAO|nr:GH92 family glycosyl hydrolase [Arenibacter nanhaiticus]SHJ77261.1 alpha-1,2-mannosidase, putative [Arenibacter nanhaiticus]
MRNIMIMLGLILLVFSCTKTKKQSKEVLALTQYVDPMIGTDAHGHTFPGATTPYGMVQLSPSNDFKDWDWCSGYHYSDTIIKGFAHNHISGAGLSGLGDILIMPTMGKNTTYAGSDAEVDTSYRSRFTHKSEKAYAGYYGVSLEDYKIDVALTATTRSGFHKYTFNQEGVTDIVIDPTHALMEKAMETSISKVSDTEVLGYKKVNMGGDKFRFMYFSAKFSKPFKKFSITNNDIVVNETSLTAAKAKALVSFTVEKGEELEIVVTLSPTGYDGVEKNYLAEAKGKTFDTALDEAVSTWNQELNKIQLDEVVSDTKKRTFYTAMYHAFIGPNIISDVDGQYVVEGKKLHSKHVQYSNFSTWDTYRALNPLLTIISQERTAAIVNSMVSRDTEANVGQPVWELFGFDNSCMIGYTTASVIGDAVLKDIPGIDHEQAYASMRGAAFDLTKHSAVYDVSGLEDYINYGYVTSETGSSVSKTTEYNYHDFVISEVAKKLGKDADAQLFKRRSIGYRNLFDPSSGYLLPKYSNGDVNLMDLSIWDELVTNYVSGNIWAYSAYTPQDMEGAIRLHGGKEKYAAWLDGVFTDTTQLGGVQHVDISGFIGKYGHGDEPGHHMPYLYNFVGQPWKTQKYVHEVISTMYSDRPDGMVNNEDLGQMSAWYIFSTLGFYPLSPSSLQYQLGAPYFEKASIHLENGNSFVVSAENLSEENIYVQSVLLNGKTYDKNFIYHKDIIKGGSIVFTMGPKPNKKWGASDESTAVGKLNESTVKIPVIAALAPFDTNERAFFADKHLVKLKSNESDASIYYTLDGSTPTQKSSLYIAPITVTSDAVLKAIAVKEGLNPSKVYEKPLVKSVFPSLKKGYPKVDMVNPDTAYGKGDGSTLFDEVFGSSSYGDGKWTGIKGNIELYLNLGEKVALNGISLGVLTDVGSWIFPAKTISVYGGNSKDNLTLIAQKEILYTEDLPKEVVRHTLALKGSYRWLRIKITPFGNAPEWHGASGQKVWLFIDEINVF